MHVSVTVVSVVAAVVQTGALSGPSSLSTDLRVPRYRITACTVFFWSMTRFFGRVRVYDTGTLTVWVVPITTGLPLFTVTPENVRSGVPAADAAGAARPARARAPDRAVPMASLRMFPHLRDGPPGDVALRSKGPWWSDPRGSPDGEGMRGSG